MIPIIREEIQGSQEWLSLRKTKITATDSGVILGLNPWKTPLQLWEEKLGLRELQPVNDKMREGSLLEEEARKFVNEKRHYNNFRPIVLQSTIYPFMMASLDGFDDNRGDPIPRILEIKCGKRSHELALNGEIPPYYMAQLQKQMFVSQISTISYFSYRNDDDNIEIIVNRDDAFIEKMIKAETKFYKCMMDFQAPPATDHDFVKRDSRELQFHLEVWKQTKAEMKLLEAKDELLRDTIIQMCDGQSSECNGVRIVKTTRRGNIQYDKIEALKEIDLEVYRSKPTTSYRFTEIKGQDD